MGREIRRVPPNWEHPRYEDEDVRYEHQRGAYHPMHDTPFSERFAEWLKDFDRVRRGKLTNIERECYPLGLADWLLDEGSPPNPKYYRPDWKEEPSWFQVYETVSEGTPVTPPFATKEELAQYLAMHGDFWDQRRREPDYRFRRETGPAGWGIEAARRFVESEWAPSLMVTVTPKGATIQEPRDGG